MVPAAGAKHAPPVMILEDIPMRQLSRRAVLVLVAALTLAGWSKNASAAAKDAADDIAKFTGGKTPEPSKIAIELPEIAENGNTVPLSITVDTPMTADNYVSEILVVAEGNPRPGVALFRCRARHWSRPVSGSPPRRTSSPSPRPVADNFLPAKSW